MIHILLRLVSKWRGKHEIAGYLGLGIGKTRYCLTEQIKKGTGISPMRWDEVLEQLRKKNMKRMKPYGESRYRTAIPGGTLKWHNS